MKKKYLAYILLLTGMIGWLAGLWRAAEFFREQPAESLRYSAQPISAGQVETVMLWAAERGNAPEYLLWEQLSGQRLAHQGGVTLFRCWGDASLLFPVEFLTGYFPLAGEEKGCAISAGLAEKVFGSSDIVGLTVEYGEEKLLVRGVFAGDELMCIRADGKDTAEFPALELRFPSGTSREEKVRFLEYSGLPAATEVYFYGEKDTLLLLVCLLPLLPAVVCGAGWLRRVWKKGKKLYWMLGGAVVCLLLLAGFGAMLLNRDFWMPTQMSNFEGWGKLWATFGEEFCLPFLPLPSLRDQLWRIGFWQVAGSMLAATGAVTAGVVLRRRGSCRSH